MPTGTLATGVVPLAGSGAARYDRLFYGGMAAALGLTVVAGFGPSYYFRFLSGGPTLTVNGGPFTPLVHVHGALFTGWVILFIAQTALVAAHRVRVHRRVGVAGAVLAAAMVVAGTLTALAAAARGQAPDGVDPLAFMAVPLFDMVVFSTLIAAALLRRRDRETHKRLMLLGYISIVTAAIARLPGVLPLGPPAFFGLMFVFIIAALAYDYVTRGRVHRAYLWGAALIVLSVPLRLGISATPVWHAFAELVTR